jgi:hypothetical protein
MAFGFFGFKKKPVIEDVVAKVPTPAAKPAPMTFDDALTAQAAAEAADHAPAEPEAPTAVAPAPVVAEPVVAVVAEIKPSVPVADAGPEAEPEVAGQMGTIKATREDVIAAYKIFLGRLPESMEVVDPRVGVAPAALLVDFLASKEFLDQAPKAQLVLTVAKKIIDARQAAKPADVTTAAPSPAVDPTSPSS